jgi:hypothetical protein
MILERVDVRQISQIWAQYLKSNVIHYTTTGEK